jgi:hypothetical protein
MAPGAFSLQITFFITFAIFIVIQFKFLMYTI